MCSAKSTTMAESKPTAENSISEAASTQPIITTGNASACRSNGQDVSRNGKQPSWKEMYQRLKHLKETTGNPNLPQRGFQDPLLQSWINDQRRQCKIAREQSSQSDNEDDSQTAGEAQSLSRCSSAGSKNPRYVSNQKNSSIFTGVEEHKLTFERVLELERLGFSWDSPHDVEWKKRYAELKRYKEVHGHCRVPARDKENPELGRWVMTQRRQYALLKQDRKSRMTRERLRLLEMIEFEWVLREDYREKWIQHIKELKGFLAKYDHFDVASVLGPNNELGKWVSRMKKQYKAYIDGNDNAHNLNKERFEELRNLGFSHFAISTMDGIVANAKPLKKVANSKKVDDAVTVTVLSKKTRARGNSNEEILHIPLAETSAGRGAGSEAVFDTEKNHAYQGKSFVADEVALTNGRFDDDTLGGAVSHEFAPSIPVSKTTNNRIYQGHFERSDDDLLPASKRAKVAAHNFKNEAEALAFFGSLPLAKHPAIDPLVESYLRAEMFIRKYRALIGQTTTLPDVTSIMQPSSAHQRFVAVPCINGEDYALRASGIAPLGYVVVPKLEHSLVAYSALHRQQQTVMDAKVRQLSSLYRI